jgi:parallel beta-helix repeat protein
MKQTILLAIRSARPGLPLLAVLSITLLCTSPAKAATIPIKSSACDNFITAPGDYTLETDIGPCGPGDIGFLIFASNVTLHLNGHKINGSAVPGNCDGTIGILVSAEFTDPSSITNTTGVHVVGPGTLSNWQQGFQANLSSSSSLSLTKVTANCAAKFSFGIIIDASQWTLLGNTVEEPGDNSEGILALGNGNYIAGNSVNDSLVLYDGNNNIVFGNFASNNSGGIVVAGGGDNQILANTTDNNNGGPGILLTEDGAGSSTTGNLVSLNRSLNNTPYDVEDDNPGCGTDKWVRNNFKTANESCIH